MSGDLEYLTTPSVLECRLLVANGKPQTIGGYAVKFGMVSNDLGGFVELVSPEFLDQTRAQNFRDVICRYNHDDNLVLGSVANGTLRCSVDKVGLDYSVDVPEWPGPPYVYAMAARGDIRHSSFAFRVDPNGGDRWEQRDGRTLRTLVRGQVTEVAPVPVPAYSQSTLGLRSLARQMDAPLADVEQLAASGELRKFFTRSDGGPDGNNPIQPAPVPAPAFIGRNGAKALAECRAMAPVMGRSRMLETQAQRWPAYQVAEWDAMPSALTPLEAERRELAEAKREVARLKDSAGLLLAELAQAEVARAEGRAEDYLASKSGQPLSGATALRLTKEMERP
jgi:uncharacterized protein